MAERTVEFDSPHFLHGLFADDLSLLREMGERMGLHVTTRDSWIRFEGVEAEVEAGASVLEDLEQARRKGGTITPHSFRYAVSAAADALANAGGHGEVKVSDFLEWRLLGGG